MLDAAEVLCLCCQPRGWPPLAPLPLLLACDALGLLVLVCSRDWYGLWYWHGPFYSLAGEIGMALFVTLPYVLTPPSKVQWASLTCNRRHTQRDSNPPGPFVWL